VVKFVLEKVNRISWLFDIYGELLTGRQRELIRLYYHDDLSLAEIAEELGISRQAVFFGLKRSEEILEQYEKQLGLLKKFTFQREKLERIISLLKDYRSSGDMKKLDTAQSLLEKFLNEMNSLN